jgi:hypothetical protein
MEAVKYVLKKIDSVVPLWDSQNKTFSIIVEGELVEIPEEVFRKLFREESIEPMSFFKVDKNKIKEGTSVSEDVFNEYVNKLKSDENVKALINFFKSANVSKNEVKEMFFKWMKNLDFINQLFNLEDLRNTSDSVIDALFE